MFCRNCKYFQKDGSLVYFGPHWCLKEDKETNEYEYCTFWEKQNFFTYSRSINYINLVISFGAIVFIFIAVLSILCLFKACYIGNMVTSAIPIYLLSVLFLIPLFSGCSILYLVIKQFLKRKEDV